LNQISSAECLKAIFRLRLEKYHALSMSFFEHLWLEKRMDSA
jgi:hypothetical protein